MTLEQAEETAAMVLADMARNGVRLDDVYVAGSVRRKRPECGDIDIVAMLTPELEEWCEDQWGRQQNGKVAMMGLWFDVQVDVNAVADRRSLGAALMFATGSAAWNVMQRGVAKARGYLLNEKGLWKKDDETTIEFIKWQVEVKVKGGTEKRLWIAGETEQQVYDAIGMEYVEPSGREIKRS